VVRLLLRRKGLRNPDPAMQAADQDPECRGHGAAPRLAGRRSFSSSPIQSVARPMLSHFNVETGARCGRAARGGAKSGPVGRLLVGRPRPGCRRLR
jgi:hypothetical protein